MHTNYKTLNMHISGIDQGCVQIEWPCLKIAVLAKIIFAS